jgi:hypothetical protein
MLLFHEKANEAAELAAVRIAHKKIPVLGLLWFIR